MVESLCKVFQPKQTDNKKESTELLKPRIMENGCEYYLAGEVRLCIEQAARQIAESNSVYKELDTIIKHQKYKRCEAMAWWCSSQVDHYHSEGYIYEHEGKKDELEDCLRLVAFYHRWFERWDSIAENYRRKLSQSNTHQWP